MIEGAGAPARISIDAWERCYVDSGKVEIEKWTNGDPKGGWWVDYVQIVSKKNRLLLEKTLFGDKRAKARLREMGLLYWEHRGRTVLERQA